MALQTVLYIKMWARFAGQEQWKTMGIENVLEKMIGKECKIMIVVENEKVVGNE